MSLRGTATKTWWTRLRAIREIGWSQFKNWASMDSNRYYRNQFDDYASSGNLNIVVNDGSMIHDAFKSVLTVETKKLMEILEENERMWLSRDDYSVYTGSAGIAYTFYHYGKSFNDAAYIKKATGLLERCVTKFKSRHEITFLTGVVGPLALTAVILHSQRKEEEAKQLILKLKSLATYVIEKRSDVPDELLYGRAGYLSGLLYINANISPPPIEPDIIKQVVTTIINSGRMYASANHCQSPLMYSWHETEYLGAAHGLAGILYLLLQARQYLTQVQMDSYVKPSLYFLQRLQFPSGNFPSSMESHSDKLIHWCHGAPGMSALFCLAHKVFEDNTFLDTAVRCAEVIWQRGLLTKGYGICHGVSGNAYAFLHLFQHTQDIKYLYRACRFAEWCFHYGTHQCRAPDRPFSMFEGLAGVIYFLVDMQQPHMAKFPSYDI
ncbi:PREDICTED: lanC-like protein 1 isoform X2 [Dinoponera quadriceps]|uniref:LanC-like protein 1 isoform X2 n=1 Tax=Dinoponera quadriceps TaxID=609295 RepID=A0A6P3XWX8_DINQU|nr:PREDICTED: lanC-like protein 1 isoform X2 [Dinoponera quadriceps]